MTELPVDDPRLLPISRVTATCDDVTGAMLIQNHGPHTVQICIGGNDIKKIPSGDWITVFNSNIDESDITCETVYE